MLFMATALTAVAQETPRTSQTSNEGFVGVTYQRQNIDTVRVNGNTFRYDADNDTAGISGGFTHYFGDDKAKEKVGTVGFTLDMNLQFDRDGARMFTIAEGVTVKARNNRKYQPFARALVGASRLGLGDRASGSGRGGQSSLALIGGVGMDVNVSDYSRYKVRFLGEYVNTRFGKQPQNNARLTVGFVF